MHRFLVYSLLLLLLFVFLVPVFGQSFAATLDFDQSTISFGVGETVDVVVRVDAGSNQISSTDAYVIYDPTLLEAQAITPATFFPTVVNNITSGRLYIAGLVDDASSSKTGSGDVATITFKALTEGTGTLTYDCQPGVFNSSKVIQNDINATNVIDCDATGRAEVTIGNATLSPTRAATTSNNNTYNNTASSSALPKTGIFDNVSRVAVPGMVLLFLGGALRLIL